MSYLRALLLLAILCTAGCNCEGDRLCLYLNSTTSTGTTTSTASAAGIWSGIDSATGLELNGFISSAGQADFIRSDGVQFVGTAQVSGTTVQMAINGYTQFGYQFSDGSTSGTGTFSGTLSSGSSSDSSNTISGTLQFTTASNTATTSTWSLTFNSLYNSASSLAAIGGTYTDHLAAVSDGIDPLSGASVTISSTGALYGQGSTDDCVLNGSASVIDSSSDLYAISYTLESCSGSEAVLNGVQFSGLAERNTSTSPAAIVVAVTGQSQTGLYYGIVSDWSSG